MFSRTAQRPPYPATPPMASGPPFHHAPNAALLIDFDNVTMAIRSDLGKELKALLNSEVIRGKVAVQRAYADWRRYPQYIVPLAESSIDLIFAPAYGSSKKNATDLRMAIDAMELVFTRPEIGTFILMTGDSDFSSCVLKLKEYGKYVIGVGMRESSSDLLIQNCDEYYSYHSLSGLTRTGTGEVSREDPWQLVGRAVVQMVRNGDVMRTDRLKQVMLELDPGFDEKEIGYSKFSRFVNEAGSKGLLTLRKAENGQYEIVPPSDVQAGAAEPSGAAAGRAAPAPAPERPREERPREERPRDDRRGRGRGRGGRAADAPPPADIGPGVVTAPVAPEPAVIAAEAPAEPEPSQERPVAAVAEAAEPAVAGEVAASGERAAVTDGMLKAAYGLLQQALRELVGRDRKAVRDGDLKRRMLDLAPGFDEAALGFSKFTRFLRQAHDAEVIDLERVNGGNYEVSVSASGPKLSAPAADVFVGMGGERARPGSTGEEPVAVPAASAPVAEEARAAETEESAKAPATRRVEPISAVVTPPSGGAAAAGTPPGMLRGRRVGGRGAPAGPPPLLPGQVVGLPGAPVTPPSEPELPSGEGPTASPDATAAPEAEAEAPRKPRGRRGGRGRGKAAEPVEPSAPTGQTAEAEPAAEPVVVAAAADEVADAAAEVAAETARSARPRRGRRGGRKAAPAAEPVAEEAAEAAQAVEAVAAPEPATEPIPEEPAPEPKKRTRGGRGRARAAKQADAPEPEAPAQPAFDASALGLPTGEAAITAYLSNSYKGIGKKTAEALLGTFGDDLFRVFQEEPNRVRELLKDRRADTLLDQWTADYERRANGTTAAQAAAETPGPAAEGEQGESGEAAEGRSRTRRGGRGRGRGKREPAPAS